MLSDDLKEKQYFTNEFAAFEADGLLDAVIVYDHTVVADWHSCGKDRVNFVFSCTKSFLSTLVGIAVDRGLIESMDVSITHYFPTLPQINPDPRYQEITIRNLLSMTSGIDWPRMDRGQSMYNKMVRSPDWVDFVLRLPLAHDPGTCFNYCDGGSHLLSAILTKVSGQSALSFARQNLFPFLGVEKAEWKENQGINLGGSGLHLRAIDMAMLGYLYSCNGELENHPVISASWVREATRVQSAGHPEWFGSYGLHWWISPQSLNLKADLFYALGSHGQYIIVASEKKLVGAFRKRPGKREKMKLPMDLFMQKVMKRYM